MAITISLQLSVTCSGTDCTTGRVPRRSAIPIVRPIICSAKNSGRHLRRASSPPGGTSPGNCRDARSFRCANHTRVAGTAQPVRADSEDARQRKRIQLFSLAALGHGPVSDYRHGVCPELWPGLCLSTNHRTAAPNRRRPGSAPSRPRRPASSLPGAIDVSTRQVSTKTASGALKVDTSPGK